jgi:hypothetical protein
MMVFTPVSQKNKILPFCDSINPLAPASLMVFTPVSQNFESLRFYDSINRWLPSP